MAFHMLDSFEVLMVTQGLIPVVKVLLCELAQRLVDMSIETLDHSRDDIWG